MIRGNFWNPSAPWWESAESAFEEINQFFELERITYSFLKSLRFGPLSANNFVKY
jgi:hypothetical protein